MKKHRSLGQHLRRKARAFRLRGPLAENPTARILHVLVLVIAIWYALWSVILLPLYPQLGIRLALALFMEAGPVAALVLLRLGFLRQASLAYLTGAWAAATFSMASRGGIRSTSQVYYVALPILATWLLGYRGALWTAGVCLASALVFAILALAGLDLARIAPVTPIATWVTLVQVILIAAVPVAHVFETLRHTLAQSNRTQQELHDYKERLEQLVEQRTAEVVEARDQALAANRAKSIFLANMSHELRTPLNAILGFSALLRRDTGLSEEHRKDLAIVGNSGEHLLGVIDDVLDMAKIEAGNITVKSSLLDLRTLVHDTVSMLRERAEAKNLGLFVDIDSAVPRFIRSDPGKLQQVLTNLVGNAVKYTDEGSVSVCVDARPGDDSEHLVLTFDVEDTGVGIALEDKGRIFDPFVRTGSSLARKGTGLGLSISQHFVQLLGGTIQVQSTPGLGSRFHVEVRAEAAQGPELMPDTSNLQVAGLEPGQPEHRILVVEDERENWLLLQRLLQNAGFKVRVAEDGRSAIDSFETWRPHLIFIDLRLPVLGGLEAARRIRKLEGGGEVKIVAVTASAFASEREEVLAAGLDDFLRKPYRPQEIFDRIARHLGVRYAYDTTLESGPHDAHGTVQSDDLAALPVKVREDLEAALISLDQDRIALLVHQIATQNPAIGGILTHLTDNTAYSPILHALRGCKTKFAGASL